MRNTTDVLFFLSLHRLIKYKKRQITIDSTVGSSSLWQVGPLQAPVTSRWGFCPFWEKIELCCQPGRAPAQKVAAGQWALGWRSAGCRPTAHGNAGHNRSFKSPFARGWRWVTIIAEGPQAHQPAENYIWGLWSLTHSGNGAATGKEDEKSSAAGNFTDHQIQFLSRGKPLVSTLEKKKNATVKNLNK